MKKQILRTLIIVAALITGTSATSAQFRYAPTIGAELTTLKFKQDLVSVTQTPSFQVGVQGEIIFPGLGFGIDTGLFYNQLGAKVNLGERKIWQSADIIDGDKVIHYPGYGNERVRLHTLQIPLHLRFKWIRMNGIEDIVAPFVYGGPDFNILVGHGKCDAFDYAGGSLDLTVGGGVELFTRWQLSYSYTWGMTYVLKTKLLDNFSARDRFMTLRLAYFF